MALRLARRADEILVEVRFPAAGPGTGAAFQEVARRHGDFAIVGLAASLTLADGAISDARLAFAGLADVPVRAADAEDLLVGQEPSAELFQEAARRATDGIDPPADLNGSPEYRKKVAATLVRRGLRAAAHEASHHRATRNDPSEDRASQDRASKESASQDSASQDSASQDSASQDSASQDSASHNNASHNNASHNNARERP